MLKSELKAYLAVLKSIKGKSRQLPVLTGVAINGNLIKTTNLSVYGQVALDIAYGEGVYDPTVLNLLENGVDADLFDQYKVHDLDDYPSVVFANTCENTRVLNDKDIDAIIKASDCVSADDARPVLTCVALWDGLICGTDGYIAYATPQSSDLYPNGEINLLLPKIFATTLKRLRKYGRWTISTNKDQSCICITNGTFILYGDNQSGQYPDMRQLLKERTTDKAYKFPLDRVLAMGDSQSDIKINRATGEISVARHLSGEWRATGITATITEEKQVLTLPRRVIMPISDPNDIVIVASLIKRLADEKTISLLTDGVSSAMLDLG